MITIVGLTLVRCPFGVMRLINENATSTLCAIADVSFHDFSNHEIEFPLLPLEIPFR